MHMGCPLKGRRGEMVRQMNMLNKDVKDRIEGIRKEGKYKHHGKEYKPDVKSKVWRIKRSRVCFSADLGKRLCQPLDQQELLGMMSLPDDHTPRNKINLC